jgi:succinate dehydrogenase flavin-adding protein (antitoxin of CptAB toxin-antitoxin module)
LKKKTDERKKANQACEEHEQMFITALNANDHTIYDWIVDSSVM